MGMIEEGSCWWPEVPVRAGADRSREPLNMSGRPGGALEKSWPGATMSARRKFDPRQTAAAGSRYSSAPAFAELGPPIDPCAARLSLALSIASEPP